MSAQDIAKDAIRIALLTEQIAALKTENANLKKKAADLEQELDRLRPKDELHQDAIRFLALLFRQGGLTTSQIAATLGIHKGMAEYHRDVLVKAKMISLLVTVTSGRENPYHLRSKGKDYLVKHGHI